jgi:hypothetical protein
VAQYWADACWWCRKQSAVRWQLQRRCARNWVTVTVRAMHTINVDVKLFLGLGLGLGLWVLHTSFSLLNGLAACICTANTSRRTRASHVFCLCLSPPGVRCMTKAWASIESCAGANKEFCCNNSNPGQTLACLTHLSLTFRMNVFLFAYKQVEHWLTMRPLLNETGKISSSVAPLISFSNFLCALHCFSVSCSVILSLQDVSVSPSLY